MAHIDTLIERISDPNLRAQLAEEVAKLVERKDFGLVFQRHLPEDVETPGVRPRRGDTVRLRGDATKQNYVVLSARAGVASIIAVDPSKKTIEDSEAAEQRFDALVVVKDFDVPIYPGLQPLGEIKRGGDKPTHVVIEGENYYALESLLYTHERKVDVIMVDPPYNTGASSWIYNDRFVGDADAYRHSKWLSFMERRLRHAKRLLKQTGVIVVAIDDTEHARLKMLLDQEFGERNFIANVVWQGGRKNDSRYVSVGHDYMLVYAKDEQALSDAGVRWREKKPGFDEAMSAAARIWRDQNGDHAAATKAWRAWLKSFKVAGAGEYSDAITRYTSLDEKTGEPIFVGRDISWPGGGGPRYDVLHPVTGQPVKVPKTGWRFRDPNQLRALIEEGRARFGADHTSGLQGVSFLAELESQVVSSVFEKDRRGATKYLESALVSKDFPFPKDVDVVARWINVVSNGAPDAVVLDFFVGTGTTAEAVMRLNAADGGHRQSIVVTNNELAKTTADKLAKRGLLPGDEEWESEGIFQKVTKPRIETVVSGTRRDGSKFSDGLDENVAFFKLTYEDENLVALGRKYDAIAPLLWLKAGGVGSVVERNGSSAWALPEDASYGVLFDVAGAREFADAVERRESALNHLFIVADSESAFQTAVSYLPVEHRLNTTRLYSDYLHSFEINGKD